MKTSTYFKLTAVWALWVIAWFAICGRGGMFEGSNPLVVLVAGIAVGISGRYIANIIVRGVIAFSWFGIDDE